MIKRAFILCVLAALVFLSACGRGTTPSDVQHGDSPVMKEESASIPDENSAFKDIAEPPAEVEMTIRATDCDSYGFYHFLNENDSTFIFTHIKDGENPARWAVYILDEEFTDAERYIPQAYESVLEENGEIVISEGKYVYLSCSANDWTDITPSENDIMQINIR